MAGSIAHFFMTIVLLMGGLGNQMFQYACGRSVAERRREDLVLHTGVLSAPTSPREFQLQVFNIRAQVRQDLEIVRDLDVLWSVQQIDSRFNSAILQSSCPNLLLRGFWESEKYFSEIRDAIRLEFTFKEEFQLGDTNLVEQIRATESVCLHVRRTDVLAPMDQKGFVGVEYYEAALRVVAERVKKPFIYVFSDDIDWCSRNLCIRYPHMFLDPRRNQNDAAPRDLRLMAECKHFIIANSTLSWWGAWLGSNPAKLVIAPRRWFRYEGLWSPQILQLFRSDDLVPDTWIRI